MKELADIFSNFILLRVYLPGLLFVVFFKLSGLPAKPPCFYVPLGEAASVWMLLPVIIGQCFHLVTATVLLAFGVEQVKDKKKPWVPACIQRRVAGQNIYVKNSETVGRIFHFGQLYVNCFIALFVCAILNWKSGQHCWGYFLFILSVVALGASVLNFLYGRGLLADSNYKVE
jgi:hypothetical protein